MESILQIIDISKSFPGIQALKKIRMEVHTGEVHAVVGENGAGKSTLMHILAGVHQPDEGSIMLEGRPVGFRDEKDAQEKGIGMVYQERSLVNDLSVAENIFAGRQPIKRFNIVDTARMNAVAKELLGRVGLHVHPRMRVAHLSSIQKQLVEIAKALSLNAKILILDEPTATITERETDILFSLIRELKKQGISIIYISHRLQELPHICDRVSVLKDGEYQGTRVMAETSLNDLVLMMVGRTVLNQYDDRGWQPDGEILRVEHFSSASFTDVSFSLRKQEILGFAGLAGAGRTEVALALFGSDRNVSGAIFMDGSKIVIKSPSAAIEKGIGYLTEDRKTAGLFLDLDIPCNMVSANLDHFSSRGLVKDGELKSKAMGYMQRLRIVAHSLQQKVVNLSGGNQQKVLMARWLMRNPRILIIDEPTRGVDIGAKHEIYELIRSMAKQGTSIIVISSELPEILALCDRIIVMWQGRITGEVLQKDATEEKIMQLASGLNI